MRSLLRVKMMIDELRLRDETFRDFGADDPAAGDAAIEGAHIVIADGRQDRAEAMSECLRARLGATVTIAANRRETLAAAHEGPADVFVISGQLGRRDETREDGLQLCSQLRSQPGTRQSSLILTIEEGDHARVAEALDFGVDDYLSRPVDESELVARMRAQLRRKRFADRLRRNMQTGLRLAMTDALTGLYNRRYADQHLSRHVAERCADAAPAMALLAFDIDHFKHVNDTYGHGVGDEVLVEFASRIREEMRGVDLIARYGGEEFLVAMPETRIDAAVRAADRVRTAVSARPFETGAGAIRITVSVGVAALSSGESAPSLLRRADDALYAAKNSGRNRIAEAPGASRAPARAAR